MTARLRSKPHYCALLLSSYSSPTSFLHTILCYTANISDYLLKVTLCRFQAAIMPRLLWSSWPTFLTSATGGTPKVLVNTTPRILANRFFWLSAVAIFPWPISIGASPVVFAWLPPIFRADGTSKFSLYPLLPSRSKPMSCSLNSFLPRHALQPYYWSALKYISPLSMQGRARLSQWEHASAPKFATTLNYLLTNESIAATVLYWNTKTQRARRNMSRMCTMKHVPLHLRMRFSVTVVSQKPYDSPK